MSSKLTPNSLNQLRFILDADLHPHQNLTAAVITHIPAGPNPTQEYAHLYLLRPNQPPTPLVTTFNHIQHPRWSPDGHYLAYTTSHLGHHQLYLYHLPTQQHTLLTPNT
ncbi:MAG TPA: hypothetical protein VLL52_22455, partial [Anaerolineae bacterium]|nr:hypothetical protein [Anaerolineae bacterium]